MDRGQGLPGPGPQDGKPPAEPPEPLPTSCPSSMLGWRLALGQGGGWRAASGRGQGRATVAQDRGEAVRSPGEQCRDSTGRAGAPSSLSLEDAGAKKRCCRERTAGLGRRGFSR